MTILVKEKESSFQLDNMWSLINKLEKLEGVQGTWSSCINKKRVIKVTQEMGVSFDPMCG